MEQQQSDPNDASVVVLPDRRDAAAKPDGDNYVSNNNNNNNNSNHNPTTSRTTRREQELSFQTILKARHMTSEEFFQTYWQTMPVLFPQTVIAASDSTTNHFRNDKNNDKSNDDEMNNNDNPLQRLIHNGWSVLLDLLEQSMKQEQELMNNTNNNTSHSLLPPAVDSDSHYFEPTLFFQDQQSLSLEERALSYQNSLFAAYLNGCSLVHNHADLLQGQLAALCQDLQQQQQQHPPPAAAFAAGFPHVYCNVYITPPDAQAVPMHADDRDVLVIQVYGQKTWTVHDRSPQWPLPYAHQQVGKQQVPLLVSTTTNTTASSTLPPRLLQPTLQPGDVLYVPRGFVHAASCAAQAPSFHVTVAIPTHDWTMAGLLCELTSNILIDRPLFINHMRDSSSSRHHENNEMSNDGGANSSTAADSWLLFQHKKALPVPCSTAWEDVPLPQQEQLQHQLNQAFALLQRQITAQTLHERLQQKYARHNEQALRQRQPLLLQIQQQKQPEEENNNPQPNQEISLVVGRQAAQTIQLDTLVRMATEEEKQWARGRLLGAATATATTLSSTAVEAPQEPWKKKRWIPAPTTTTTTTTTGLQVRECIADDITEMLQTMSRLQQEYQQQKDTCAKRDEPRASYSNNNHNDKHHNNKNNNNHNDMPCYRVGDLPSQLLTSRSPDPRLCDLTLICLAKQCVTLGAWAIALVVEEKD